MPHEFMPRGFQEQENPQEESRSPEERIAEIAVELSSSGASAEDIDMVRSAFEAGKKWSSEELGRIVIDASSQGKIKLLGKINEAWVLGERARFESDSSAAPSLPETAEEEKLRAYYELEKRAVELWIKIGGESREEAQKTFGRMFSELLKGARERAPGREKESVKEFLRMVIDSAPPEKINKNLQTLKEKEPKKYNELRDKLIYLLDEEDDEKRKQKTEEVVRPYLAGGEILGNVHDLMKEAREVYKLLSGPEVGQEEKKRAEEDSEKIKAGAGKAGSRLWEAGGVMAIVLLGVLILLMIQLAALNMLLGKTKTKK